MDVNLYVDDNHDEITLQVDNQVPTDTTLTIPGMAADAKATGDAITAEETARVNAVTGEATARANADADLQTQIDQIITPGGAPSEAEITNARIGADGTVYDNLGTAIRTQVDDLQDGLDASRFYKRIPLFPCQFSGNAYVNGSGTVSSNSHGICNIYNLIFKTGAPIRIYTTDNNLYLNILEQNTSGLSDNFQDIVYSGRDNFKLDIRSYDSTEIKSSDLDSIYIMGTQAVYDDYMANNMLHLTNTAKFPDYGSYIFRYGMYTDANKLGFAQRSQNYYRITKFPFISESDLTVICGRSGSSNNLEIVINGVLTTLTIGQWMTIPANTPFQVAFKSASTSGTNSISSASIYIVKDSEPTHGLIQYLCSERTDRVDAAFMVGEKIFTIAQTSYTTYSVFYNGQYVVSAQPLDHDPGHANTCNYDNGYVYVSDWYINNLIHVYAVDADNNTLTYTKDIALPASNYGRTGYYVQNSEKEILFVGWESGAAGTTPNNLVYGLYVLREDGYILAWERKARRPLLLQGFSYQNNNLYLVECERETYDTTAILELNMVTGLMRSSSVSNTTLGGEEGEAIIPVDNKTFFIVDGKGQLYFKTM